MIVGDRILLIHFRLGEAIYKYLYNKREHSVNIHFWIFTDIFSVDYLFYL